MTVGMKTRDRCSDLHWIDDAQCAPISWSNSVQQALKDQGFYYGEVSGEMNANLTAAIRRYQIRNGLQVSGELNNETLKSLGIDLLRQRDRPRSMIARPCRACRTRSNDLQADQTRSCTTSSTFGNAPQDQRIYPSNPAAPGLHPEEGLLPAPHSRPLLPRATQCGAFGSDRAGPIVAFITKRLTDFMGQQWNLPCGLINREQGFG